MMESRTSKQELAHDNCRARSSKEKRRKSSSRKRGDAASTAPPSSSLSSAALSLPSPSSSSTTTSTAHTPISPVLPMTTPMETPMATPIAEVTREGSMHSNTNHTTNHNALMPTQQNHRSRGDSRNRERKGNGDGNGDGNEAGNNSSANGHSTHSRRIVALHQIVDESDEHRVHHNSDSNYNDITIRNTASSVRGNHGEHGLRFPVGPLDSAASNTATRMDDVDFDLDDITSELGGSLPNDSNHSAQPSQASMTERHFGGNMDDGATRTSKETTATETATTATSTGNAGSSVTATTHKPRIRRFQLHSLLPLHQQQQQHQQQRMRRPSHMIPIQHTDFRESCEVALNDAGANNYDASANERLWKQSSSNSLSRLDTSTPENIRDEMAQEDLIDTKSFSWTDFRNDGVDQEQGREDARPAGTNINASFGDRADGMDIGADPNATTDSTSNSGRPGNGQGQVSNGGGGVGIVRAQTSTANRSKQLTGNDCADEMTTDAAAAGTEPTLHPLETQNQAITQPSDSHKRRLQDTMSHASATPSLKGNAENAQSNEKEATDRPDLDHGDAPLSKSSVVSKESNSGSRRRKKSKAMPKRALSAYNLFYQSERENIQKQAEKKGEKIGFKGLAKIIAKRWKNLTQGQLKIYRERAEKEVERHQRDMKAYKEFKSKQLEKLNESDSSYKELISFSASAIGPSEPSQPQYGDTTTPLHMPQPRNAIMNAAAATETTTAVPSSSMPLSPQHHFPRTYNDGFPERPSFYGGPNASVHKDGAVASSSASQLELFDTGPAHGASAGHSKTASESSGRHYSPHPNGVLTNSDAPRFGNNVASNPISISMSAPTSAAAPASASAAAPSSYQSMYLHRSQPAGSGSHNHATTRSASSSSAPQTDVAHTTTSSSSGPMRMNGLGAPGHPGQHAHSSRPYPIDDRSAMAAMRQAYPSLPSGAHPPLDANQMPLPSGMQITLPNRSGQERKYEVKYMCIEASAGEAQVLCQEAIQQSRSSARPNELMNQTQSSFMKLPPGLEVVLPDQTGNERKYRVEINCFFMTKQTASEVCHCVASPTSDSRGWSNPTASFRQEHTGSGRSEYLEAASRLPYNHQSGQPHLQQPQQHHHHNSSSSPARVRPLPGTAMASSSAPVPAPADTGPHRMPGVGRTSAYAFSAATAEAPAPVNAGYSHTYGHGHTHGHGRRPGGEMGGNGTSPSAIPSMSGAPQPAPSSALPSHYKHYSGSRNYPPMYQPMQGYTNGRDDRNPTTNRNSGYVGHDDRRMSTMSSAAATGTAIGSAATVGSGSRGGPSDSNARFGNSENPQVMHAWNASSHWNQQY